MSGLYIHVPFCKSKCAYCDFYSLPRINDYMARYLKALSVEWHMRRGEVDDIGTIYIGGGTPSVLSPEALAELGRWLPVSNRVNEFTIEVNPDDVEEELIEQWLRLGVNRVSMGVQSLNDAELKTIGRRHDGARAIHAAHKLKDHFENISLDIILGLPGQSLQSLEQTLTEIICLKPQHLSVYILSYEAGTRLSVWRDKGIVSEASDELIEQMYHMTCSMLSDAGYKHYEISNFALPGFSSKHNSSYWNNTPYLGLGPSAHSFDGKARRFNPSNINQWLVALERSSLPCQVEKETDTNIVNDIIMTRLRTAAGLDLDDIPERFRGVLLSNIETVPYGRLVRQGNVITIPERQWLLSDDTIARLFIDT
ncbi:MAG: radical SAM family heme chaperone HemW [Muribaculaceae bacterium]|nr:radical SAM family heme chaperone HemW [Muribaculaceae bacterium]